jgi:hypothetical protein
MNGKNIGDIGELVVLTEFVKRGIPVFIPYGENNKIDLIAICDGKPQRIQVKTSGSIESNNTYIISLKNSSLRSNGSSVVTLCTEEDVDFFALYCLDRPEPLLFSYEELKNKSSITIRFDDVFYSTSIYEKDYVFSKRLKEKELHVKIKEKSNTCIDCGILITDNSTRCSSCAAKKVHKEKGKGCPYTRDELKKEIRNSSFLSIGKKNDVSDNAVRKWCDKYNLPRRKEDIKKYSDEEWILI